MSINPLLARSPFPPPDQSQVGELNQRRTDSSRRPCAIGRGMALKEDNSNRETGKDSWFEGLNQFSGQALG